MFANQMPAGGSQALRLATGLLLAGLLASCVVPETNTRAAAPAAGPVAGESGTAPSLTATEAATDEADESGTTTVIGDASGMLNASAPRDYVVRRGDTLWGLASMYLRDPWLWPEIWYVNPQVRNPHLIYPGDTLHLAYGKDGKPQIQLERGSAARLHPQLRASDIDAPISAIPYDAIASFLSKPTVLSSEQVHDAPHVLALVDQHLVAGQTSEVYVRGLTAGVGERFQVIHVDEPITDPDTGSKLGYLGVYAGTVQVKRAGETAKVEVADSAREIVAGDILVADTSPATLSLVPHVPSQELRGRIAAIVDGVLLAGQYEVVAINRGTDQGLAPGHVLAIDQAGTTVRDRCARIAGTATCRLGSNVKLPDEVSGNLLIFKTYAKVSYALVLAETYPVSVGDVVHKP